MDNKELVKRIAVAFRRTDPANPVRTSIISHTKVRQWEIDRCYVADALGLDPDVTSKERVDFYAACEANR